ncbi:APC family permease [Cryptosporangium aurantiacum]|uniref:APC family permease n=1 Tax=Cryptosporangium aurantiacum TaxID=134849 RepID=UPI0015BB6208|nr:APC family permease [Cryptosporangium aurantiacum]
MTHTPLTVLWGAVPESYRSGQVEASPLVWAFAGIVLLGFVFGYSGLAKRLRHPGGVYVQVAHGLGRPIGVGAAAVMLVAYVGLMGALYSFFAGVLKGLVLSLFDVEIPIAVGVVFCAVGGVLLSRLRPRRLVPLFSVILVIQLITVVVTMAAAFSSPAGGTVSYQSLEPGGLLTGSFGVALVLALMASAGTETAANYTAELANPVRSLPRATYLSYAVTTAVGVGGALAVSALVGPTNATAIAQQAGPALFPVLVAQVVGVENAVLVTNILMAVLLTGVFGATVGLQGALVRQLAGLSSDGVLPPALIRPNARGKRPLVLNVAHPVASGLVALLFADEAGALKSWVTIGCTLGLFAMLTLASLSATVWFLRGEADESGFFGWEGQVVAAAFSAVTLFLIVVYGLTHIPALDTSDTSGATWYVLALIFLPFVLGVVATLVMRETRPEVYAKIGRGGLPDGDSEADELATSSRAVAPQPAAAATRYAAYPAAPPPSAGPYAAGQNPSGPYADGPYAEGPYPGNLQPVDPYAAAQPGPHSPVPYPAGPPNQYAALAHPEPANRPGPYPAGATPAGATPAGVNAAGPYPASGQPEAPYPPLPQREAPAGDIPRPRVPQDASWPDALNRPAVPQRAGAEPTPDGYTWWDDNGERAPEPDDGRPAVGSRSLDRRRWDNTPER